MQRSDRSRSRSSRDYVNDDLDHLEILNCRYEMLCRICMVTDVTQKAPARSCRLYGNRDRSYGSGIYLLWKNGLKDLRHRWCVRGVAYCYPSSCFASCDRQRGRRGSTGRLQMGCNSRHNAVVLGIRQSCERERWTSRQKESSTLKRTGRVDKNGIK